MPNLELAWTVSSRLRKNALCAQNATTGAKALVDSGDLYAALKRRSSTALHALALHAFLSFSAAC